MVTPVRKALFNLRSGIEIAGSIAELVAAGRSAMPILARELGMQSHSSLMTAKLITVLGEIAAGNPRVVSSDAIKVIDREATRFIPRQVTGSDRSHWIATNLQLLGTQLLRSRYQLDAPEIVRAETAVRAANPDLPSLADVLDGDLDAVEDQKKDYVGRIADCLTDYVSRHELDLALGIARILGYFGPMAQDAMPSLLELLRIEVERSEGETSRICTVLEAFERMGAGAAEAIPNVIELLDFDTETLIREDGLTIRVLDTLGGIGRDSDEVLRALRRSLKHSAAIIQSKTKDTMWKLCIESA